MNQDQIEALLGRSLSSTEATNRKLYLDIAKDSLEELLCIQLDCQNVEEARVFNVRDGYSTVFTDIFTEATEVKVDGVATTDYYSAFWDKRNGSYFNSIVLDESCGSSIEVTATWGFDETPNDLKLLWAELFANVAKKYSVGSANVKSKQVEDFRVSYGDLTDDDAFLNANRRTISKYRMCDIGFVLHGDVCTTHRETHCEHCI